MLWLLGVLFLVVPIAELAVIVQVAQGLGVVNTIAVLVLISVVGAWLVKREGVGILRRLQLTMQRGQLPHRELVDGALVMFAGALLLTPGFLTDLLGLLLLVPPTRAVARTAIMRRVRAGVVTRVRYGRAAPVVDVDGRDRAGHRPPVARPELD